MLDRIRDSLYDGRWSRHHKSGINITYSSTHGELVDSGIHAPIITLNHVGLQNDTLRLLLQEIHKVRLNARVVSTGNVRDGGKKNRLGCISLGDGIGIQSSESVVPQREQLGNLSVRKDRSRAFRARGRKECTSLEGFNLLESFKSRSLTGNRCSYLRQGTLRPIEGYFIIFKMKHDGVRRIRAGEEKTGSLNAFELLTAAARWQTGRAILVMVLALNMLVEFLERRGNYDMTKPATDISDLWVRCCPIILRKFP